MSASSVVTAGRRAAEARMLDTFEVRVPNGNGWHYDEFAGEDVEDYDVLIPAQKGRVKVSGGVLATQTPEVGGRTAEVATRQWHIPVSAPAIPANAYAVCTAVHETSDPTLLGARLVLGGPAPGSQTTARRIEVTEVLG